MQDSGGLLRSENFEADRECMGKILQIRIYRSEPGPT